MALSALAWGLVAGSAVFVGALAAWLARVPVRLIAAAMAFASGILLSVAAFELLAEAFAHGGFLPTAAGYVAGAALFGIGLHALARAGAHRRKHPRVAPGTAPAAGVVALATVLDSVPEALIVGMNFYTGQGLGIATVAAVFLANLPESVAATTRMKAAGHGAGYVFGVWLAVAVATGLASLGGYMLLGDLRPEGIAAIRAFAGGAFLVFIADAMIPEAFAETHNAAGVLVALGFLAGFALSHGLG